MTALDKVRRRHAELLDPLYAMPNPAEIELAIFYIDRFLRKGKRAPAITQKARVARSSLRGIMKLL